MAESGGARGEYVSNDKDGGVLVRVCVLHELLDGSVVYTVVPCECQVVSHYSVAVCPEFSYVPYGENP